MDSAVSFGEVLKEIRNRKKLSRPRLAQRLHMHPSSIEKWERGDVLPDRARVEDLIRVLELTEAERLLPSLHNVPAAQNPYFTGREEVLAQLHDQLVPGGQVALTQAISGLGGIGKTQVALHYVYRFQKAYSHVLWVTADSPASLAAEFVRLAHDLDLPEKDEKDQGKIVQAVQRWLREYLNWLLILDNIEDFSLVSSFIPAGHLGFVLLTTRRQVTEPVAQALVLDSLSDDDGALLLLKRAKQLALDKSLTEAQASEVKVARTITQHLGGLPLAIDQAGAYIAENRCSLSHYLDLFKQRQTALLQRRGTVKSDHPQSVTTTFALAFEQVHQKNPSARDLLNVCAFLAPDAIPLEVFTKGAAYLGTVLETVAVDALQLDQALETLQAYSLVRRDGESRTLSIHRLVQAVLRDAMTEQKREQWAKCAVLAVNVVFPDVELATWSQCDRLLSQALVCHEHIEQEQFICPEAARLLNEAGYYLKVRARYYEAEQLYLHALAIREQQFGLQHPDVAASLDRLAILYHEQGKYAQAEPLYQRALTILEQQLGPEHLQVAHPLNNLADLYREQGKYAQAEPLLQRTLQIFEQQVGPEHSLVAYPLFNLANLYHEQGKYAQAEPLYQRALTILEQSRGPDHPDVAHPLNGLADLYREQGKYAQAEPLYQRALRIRQRSLVPQHPNTAETLHDLARLREAQGNSEEARALYTQALEIREQALVAHHPRTMETHEHLIALLHAMGQQEEVARLETEQEKSEVEQKTHSEK